MDARAADALVERLRAARPLFLLHVNADPDCVGSAVALHEAFGGVVGAPDGLSRAGERVARDAGLEIDTWPHPEQFETVVAVDTSSRSQLGRMGPRVPAPCLVDHHRYGDLLDTAPAHAWDPARASCCEVALALLDRAGVQVSPRAARALLVGLVADTARFRYADPHALEAAARLVRASGLTLEQAYALLEGDEESHEADDRARRQATLLAATRAQVDVWGEHLVATSEVGAFDAAAAAALVRAGADLAVVGRERSMEARMSLRASPRALARGLDLGQVANEAARAVGWSGGGHAASAGLNGKPPLARARAEVLRIARSKLEAA